MTRAGGLGQVLDVGVDEVDAPEQRPDEAENEYQNDHDQTGDREPVLEKDIGRELPCAPLDARLAAFHLRGDVRAERIEAADGSSDAQSVILTRGSTTA